MSETLSVAEAAKLLGVNRRKITSLVKGGQIPAFKYGSPERSYFRIRPEDLNTLFKRQTLRESA